MPAHTYALRPMVAADSGAVAALIRAAFAQSVVTDPVPSALRVADADLSPHLRCGVGAMAEAANRLIGSAAGLVQPRHREGARGRGGNGSAPAAPASHPSEHALLLENRRLFAACGFVETTRETHPAYAEPTFVNMQEPLNPTETH